MTWLVREYQKEKRICRTIKVNILVVRMIFDTRNGGWSLDQNVIIFHDTFSPFMYIYRKCIVSIDQSLVFFTVDYAHTTLIFHLIRIDEQEEPLSSHGTLQTINRGISFFFASNNNHTIYTHEMKNGNSLIHIWSPLVSTHSIRRMSITRRRKKRKRRTEHEHFYPIEYITMYSIPALWIFINPSVRKR
jgi:hypothetical protein